MRAHIPLSAIIAMAVITSASAQSLPDQAEPSLSHKSSTSSQKSITNPGGFGKATNLKAIDPDGTGSAGDLDCRQQKDIRTARRATPNFDKDCVR